MSNIDTLRTDTVTLVLDSDTIETGHNLPPRKSEKTILAPGETLRIVALKKFGNKEFWVYIYLKNKEKIKNPNVVSAGMELLIPEPDEFDIDPSNPASVLKAKEMGDKELGR